ncbi:MAG: S8 family serine peptidase [Planctomycetota bacterium]
MKEEGCCRTSTPRQARWAAICVVLMLLSWFPTEPAAGQVQWQSGERRAMPALTAAGTATAIRAMVEPDQRRHVIVMFSEKVDANTRGRMRAAGVQLLSYLGDNTFFAVVNEPLLNDAALAGISSLRSATTTKRSFKLHPSFAAGAFPQWAVVGQASLPGGPGVEPMVGAYILFHPDVLLDEGIALAMAYGAIVRDELESINGLVIDVPLSSVSLLADTDPVQWIEPPLPPFAEVNDSNRVITQADDVQGPPDNLDGSGVTVLVYDGGYARSSHNDFGGRLTVHDSSGLSDHATHTCGTVGGDGSSSGGTYRGMAPAVDLLSYGFQYNGQDIFLYSNPGDIESDYSQAISTFGADVANNSIGTNTAINGFPCDITGNYGVTSVLIDTIVRGDGSNALFDEPFRIIWSNGNERQTTNCGDTYYTTAPPACAKNHITVGALNSNNDSMTSFSSWGPADDGRIKPDVSAPGCQSNDDGGVTSTSSASDSAYTVKCGTSMSGPTVCGLSALLLEDFRAQFPGQPDPRNSTLKVLLAHTAQDNGNPGPDHQFGYGSVRIQDALGLMRSGQFTEDSISQGETTFYQVQVDPGDPELKVTLAWDDVPGTPNIDPALVNDLDLLVTGPGGTAYPWTLDPANPGNNAVQTQADHINNIEQVYIANPAAGTWTVEVNGFDVSQGPQPYSLSGGGAVNNGLFLTVPGGTPDLLVPDTPTDIDVQITAIGESIVNGSPTLHYRDGPGPYSTATMTAMGGDIFRATLPAMACTDVPEFYFSAEGTLSGVVFNPANAPTGTYTPMVGTETVAFSDNFEADQGWTAENLGASSGDWQRGVPVDDPGWQYDPASDGDGSGQAYLTQNETGNTDVDGGAVRLTSPVFDMTGSGLSVAYEYYLRLTNTDGSDRLLVEMSSNADAGPWVVVATHDTDGGSVWRHHEMAQDDLETAGLMLTATMKIRFTANDADPQSINEAGVDGFVVSGIGCAGGLCGNGVPDPGEDCENCPQDIECPPGTECIGGICEPLCGNGVPDPGEDCENCPQDIVCPPGTECIGGICEPLCGNGVPDPGEDCANCLPDVP